MITASIVNIILILAMLGFAIWKKGWLRIILSVCLVIWGVFYISQDIKVAAPLIATGLALFIQSILAYIQHAREEIE